MIEGILILLLIIIAALVGASTFLKSVKLIPKLLLTYLKTLFPKKDNNG